MSSTQACRSALEKVYRRLSQLTTTPSIHPSVEHCCRQTHHNPMVLLCLQIEDKKIGLGRVICLEDHISIENNVQIIYMYANKLNKVHDSQKN
jgi:hypothetical protein